MHLMQERVLGSRCSCTYDCQRGWRICKRQKRALMVDRDVTVKDIDKNGILTCDEALIAAHDEYYNDGAIAGYATADGKYGKYISKILGR